MLFAGGPCRKATCDFMNQYLYDDGGNRTKLVHMNAVYSKDGNGRIVSMLTKASASNQGLTKTYLYANFTELTKMTAYFRDRIRITSKEIPVKAHFHKSNSYPVPEMHLI